MNIFSLSDSTRFVLVNGRKISPMDALKTALVASVKSDTSDRETQPFDTLSSGSFQFLVNCTFCSVEFCQ